MQLCQLTVTLLAEVSIPTLKNQYLEYMKQDRENRREKNKSVYCIHILIYSDIFHM